MSPFTVEPQHDFPSMEDMSQYSIHGLPLMGGLQNGHSSSMDSTPGGQYPMGSMSGGLERMTPGPQYTLDPSAFPAHQPAITYPDMTTFENVHERIRQLQRPASEATNPPSKFDIHLSLPRAQHNLSTTTIHSSQHVASRPEGKQDRKQQVDTTRRPHSYDVPRQAKSLHPTSAERRARACCISSSAAPL